jgi:hypothetical protein
MTAGAMNTERSGRRTRPKAFDEVVYALFTVHPMVPKGASRDRVRSGKLVKRT